MDIKATRHTSTNLDEINERIERILKDASHYENDKSIDLNTLTLPELKAFAEQGGLGACVSKTDVLAETSEDLMYLSGERITVLKHIEDDYYLGYCEGVIGRFNAENVHFVELDPRVLDSLDGGLDIESLGVRSSSDHGERYSSSHNMMMVMDDPRLQPQPRRSMQSYHSSTSQEYTSSPHQQHFNGLNKQPWLGRSSMDSLITTSTASGKSHFNDSGVGQPRVYRSSYLKNNSNNTEIYDTSAFNDSYSNESEDDDDDDDDDMDDYGRHHHHIPSGAPTTRSSSASSSQRFTPYDQHTPTTLESATTTTSKFSMTSASTTTRGSRLAKYQANYHNNDGRDGDDDYDEKDDSGGQINNDIPPNMSVDENGFIVSNAELEKRQRSASARPSGKSMKHYREREVKWLSIVNKMDAGSVKKDTKLKKLVRSGIPTSVRSRVWQFLAGSNHYAQQQPTNNQFQALAARPSTPIYNVIDRDLPRCYPDHTLFRDEHSQGQHDLGMILKAYAHYNPQLEYCQGMGRLAGCMLMHMPTEDAFWLLVCTIDRYMNGYFTPELSQLRIDAYIIGQLLKDHEPKLAQHLESNDVTPIMYIAQWFLTAFTMTLPWQSVLRVWDVFYFEGVKVFYRISLAILQICKDHLLQSCPTNSEILGFLLHIPHDYLSADVLLETAFHIKLSKTDIGRYAKKATTASGAADAMGLPFEHGLKNLRISGSMPLSSSSHLSNSSHSLGSSLKDRIKKKGSSLNLKDQQQQQSIALPVASPPPLPVSSV